MAPNRLVRHLLLLALGLVVGFIALAIAISVEPLLLPWAIALFSPGLKLAELLLPESRQSIAWTFGWFLRIAIAGNAVFYYAISVLVALAFRGRTTK